jgi:membrane-associated phospholipid phosphatase
MDIVAGAFIGFLCAYVAANSILIAEIKRQLLPT